MNGLGAEPELDNAMQRQISLEDYNCNQFTGIALYERNR